MFHPQGKDPMWLKIDTSILTVRCQAPARQQGEVTSGPSHLLRSPRHLHTHTHPHVSTYSCVHRHLRSDAAPVPEERAEAFVMTPDRGADSPRRRVHHKLPGGGGREPRARCGQTQRAAQRELRWTAEQRGAGGPSVQASGASRVPRVHTSRKDGGWEGTGRGRISAAGSALRAAGRPGLLAETGPSPLGSLTWRRRDPRFTPPRGDRGLGQSQGTAGPKRRRPPAGTARGQAQTPGHRPALAGGGRAAQLSLPWAVWCPHVHQDRRDTCPPHPTPTALAPLGAPP